MSIPLLIIGGATASGKTALAAELALRLNGEVVSADSMQVYKYLDIGTAKPTALDMRGVPHYMLDIITPDTPFSVADYALMAKKHIIDIANRGHLPILAGGTGFYINAVLRDTEFTSTAADFEYRNELLNLASQNGAQFLHNRLREVDIEAAAAIHPNNVKRVVRALEYYKLTGEPISAHNSREAAKKSPYRYFFTELALKRETLYKRIDERTELMLEQGLTNEVKSLRAMGYNNAHTPMRGLGYKQIGEYLDNKITLEEAKAQIKQNTRHYAKRQLTWFRNKTDAKSIYAQNLDISKFIDEIKEHCL